MKRFLSDLYREFQASDIPRQAKIIVSAVVLVILLISFAIGGVIAGLVVDFLSTPVSDIRNWHLLALMGISWVMFKRKRDE